MRVHCDGRILMIRSMPNRKRRCGMVCRLMSLFDVLSEFVMSFLVFGLGL